MEEVLPSVEVKFLVSASFFLAAYDSVKKAFARSFHLRIPAIQSRKKEMDNRLILFFISKKYHLQLNDRLIE